jgi:competence protein ComEC
MLDVLSAGYTGIGEPLNDSSVVTRLRYGDVSFLFTGDITSALERRLIQSGVPLQATVLKVPHHGSDTSSSPEFLAAVSPSLIVVQVGDRNRFGHPSAEVMERLLDYVPQDRVFVTRDDGAVVVTTDGERLWVDSRR